MRQGLRGKKEKEKREGKTRTRDFRGEGGVHLPGICPFIWLGMWGAGGPLLTMPSEGML